MFMRMYENFSGCRILSYCVMSNHFLLLLEVPPMAGDGLSDEVLLHRLSALYPEAGVAAELAELAELAEARRRGPGPDGGFDEARVAAIHARFTYRTHTRTGTLWEERFKSVIVESGVAARTMAA